MWLWIKTVAFGQKPDSESGSNSRRLLSRVALLFVVSLAIESFSPFGFSLNGVPGAGFYAVCYALFFFAYVVVFVTFLASATFSLNPTRLFFDGCISITLNVLSFALLYREIGINPPPHTILVNRDFIYFSAVTFSTLGYGDFSPKPDARLWASLQAIIGNLHLGVVVGAAFLAAARSRA